MPPVLRPPLLQEGDVVRLVSPASFVDEGYLARLSGILTSWKLEVQHGTHVLCRHGFLAGTDEKRLADLNDAFNDPTVRAVIATRGGKGSYRIAGDIDFVALRRDPKWFVGFSDNTILHLAMQRDCGLVGVHSAVFGMAESASHKDAAGSVRAALMETEPRVVTRSSGEPTAVLTTSGQIEGRLVGGNLDLVATAAGWALPSLKEAIVLLEAVGKHPGEVDRMLTMLRKGGCFDGVAGFAIGRFTGSSPKAEATIIALLTDHLRHMDVPVLGGLPIGHGDGMEAVRIGGPARLDADEGRLIVL
ncbi:LD-carboxypeptidase [Jiella sp. KSK16Y-1]|uniref:LD-carboxypeptidase n=1 Tax=Jiella mangrovi TaxID=2821407 RepID=A0ABS4BGH2_9HYPH|nr:LD-carboxypeptidase [Jiella mangrovi]